jgi:hypothetical protein
MAHLIVKDGALCVSDRALVTSHDGAPCVCGGVVDGLGILNLRIEISGSVERRVPRHGFGGFGQPQIYLGDDVTRFTWDLRVGPRNEQVPSGSTCVYPASGTAVNEFVSESGTVVRTEFAATRWLVGSAFPPGGPIFLANSNLGHGVITRVRPNISGTYMQFRDGEPLFDSPRDATLELAYRYDSGPEGDEFPDPLPGPGGEAVAGPVTLPSAGPTSGAERVVLFPSDGVDYGAAVSTQGNFPTLTAIDEPLVEYGDSTTASDGETRRATYESNVSISVSGTWVDYVPPENCPDGTGPDFDSQDEQITSGNNLGALAQNPQQSQIDHFGCSGCGG